jgi:hypothetical protein
MCEANWTAFCTTNVLSPCISILFSPVALFVTAKSVHPCRGLDSTFFIVLDYPEIFLG